MSAGPIPPVLLAHIPGCEQGRAPLAIAPLPGGRGANEVLRVDTSQGRFVWRRRRPPLDRPGSAALMELRAQQLASAAGLAPKVLASDPHGQWLLMEFIDAPLWTEAQLHSAAGVERLGRRLAALHALPVPADLPAFDAVGIARGYVAQLAARDITLAAGGAQLAARVEMLAAELRAAQPRRALVHGDLAVANMLGGAPLLVDWEYAQVTDPGWDMACLLSYYPDLVMLTPQLLAAAGLEGPLERARLALQHEIFGLLNRLWHKVHDQ